MWKAYTSILRKYPLRTQMITSAIIWSTGDIISQTMFSKEAPKDRELDVKSLLAASVFGGFLLGPAGHFWYESLDRYCIKSLHLHPGTWRLVLTKLSLDTVFFGPLCISTFLVYMTISMGGSLTDAKNKLSNDFLPILALETMYWPAVQAVNFRLIPLHHQLLFVNMVSLVDSTFFCWMKSHDDWLSLLLGIIRMKRISSDEK